MPDRHGLSFKRWLRLHKEEEAVEVDQVREDLGPAWEVFYCWEVSL
jgi:hypothetical protein